MHPPFLFLCNGLLPFAIFVVIFTEPQQNKRKKYYKYSIIYINFTSTAHKATEHTKCPHTKSAKKILKF